MNLPILNAAEAKYECTFGRGCDGLCCQNGRPPLYPDEIERITDNIPRILPLLTPAAAALVAKQGFVSRRIKARQQSARVLNGWCVFFNGGCVLQKLGAADGETFRFKPVACALFPLTRDDQDQWYIRQRGYKGEIWDLPCLDPAGKDQYAVETLAAEIELAERITHEELRVAEKKA